jgi:hypothetical protein
MFHKAKTAVIISNKPIKLKYDVDTMQYKYFIEDLASTAMYLSAVWSQLSISSKMSEI